MLTFLWYPNDQNNNKMDISLSWKSGSSLCQGFARITNEMPVLFADERCTPTPEWRMIYCSSTNIAASVPTAINYTTLLLESAPVCLYVVYWSRTWTCAFYKSPQSPHPQLKQGLCTQKNEKNWGRVKAKRKGSRTESERNFSPPAADSPSPHQPLF